MEPHEFSYILERGLGSAIMFLQQHDATPYRDVILDACLRDTRYDPQIESRRSPYLFDVIQLTGDPVFFRDRILDALDTLDDPDTRTAHQLNGLAAHFAKQGDAAAREAVIAQFTAHCTSEDEWSVYVRARDVIMIDGAQGALLVAEHIGALVNVQALPESWIPPVEFDDDDPEEQEFWAAVVREAAHNLTIATYVDYVHTYRRELERYRRPRRRSRTTPPSYDEFSARMAAKNWKGLFAPQRWSRQASETDLVRAAENLLALIAAGDNIRAILAHLRIFERRPFPLDPTRLIRLVQTRYPAPKTYNDHGWWTPETRLVSYTLNLLENVVHPAVRALALEIIATSREWIAHAVDLLRENWHDGDWDIIEPLTILALDDTVYHGLGINIRKIHEAHPSPDGATSLLNLYAHGRCSECRSYFVEELHATESLPAQLLEECCFDANLDLREWAQTHRA